MNVTMNERWESATVKAYVTSVFKGEVFYSFKPHGESLWKGSSLPLQQFIEQFTRTHDAHGNDVSAVSVGDVWNSAIAYDGVVYAIEGDDVRFCSSGEDGWIHYTVNKEDLIKNYDRISTAKKEDG